VEDGQNDNLQDVEPNYSWAKMTSERWQYHYFIFYIDSIGWSISKICSHMPIITFQKWEWHILRVSNIGCYICHYIIYIYIYF